MTKWWCICIVSQLYVYFSVLLSTLVISVNCVPVGNSLSVIQTNFEYAYNEDIFLCDLRRFSLIYAGIASGRVSTAPAVVAAP